MALRINNVTSFFKGGNIIFTQIQNQYNKLETEIQLTQNELLQLPSGTLSCARNGTQFKWYHCDKHSVSYLSKKNRQLAEQLARKMYLTLHLEDLRKEKDALQAYLNRHSNLSKADALWKKPGFKDLLPTAFTPTSQVLSDWANAPYPRNFYHPEHLIHQGTSGNLLRSKSESIIDTFLFLNKIPFRYECALKLGDTFIYPDFTIRHPRTGEIYYWEHFGLMDNPSYCEKAFSKLHLYASNGIIPTIHLITTYETKDCPLSADAVKKIITEYFL